MQRQSLTQVRVKALSLGRWEKAIRQKKQLIKSAHDSKRKDNIVKANGLGLRFNIHIKRH